MACARQEGCFSADSRVWVMQMPIDEQQRAAACMRASSVDAAAADGSAMSLQGAVQVTMRELRVGQHVLCAGTDDGFRAPTSLAWCRVMSWVSAGRILDTHAVQ